MEKNNEKPKLYISMYDGFFMRYDGKLLMGDSREKSQFALLMQTILFHRKKGVDRQTLIKTLFDDHKMEDVSHSLRNSLYMAKKRLRQMGLPDAEYIIREKNIYYWTDEIEVVIDCEEFEELIYDALQLPDIEACIKMLSEASEKCTGAFLPHMKGTYWIEGEAQRQRDIFRNCIWQINFRATRLKQFEVLYKAALHACRVDPYANWEALVLKALVGMNRFDEADRWYRDSEALYIAKYGDRSAREVRVLLDELGKYVLHEDQSLKEIQERLKGSEKDALGGYFCPFPLFMDLYRSLERVMMRTGEIIHIMLCTLTDREGKLFSESEDHEELSEWLQRVLIRSVRRTDTITRYGKNQYLILLYGTNEENCSIIQNRIESNFQKEGQDAALKFEVSDVVPYRG